MDYLQHIHTLWSHGVLLSRIEIEKEVRLQVDELMREELKNLKLVCTAHTHTHACMHTYNVHTQTHTNTHQLLQYVFYNLRLWTGTKVARKRKAKRKGKR